MTYLIARYAATQPLRVVPDLQHMMLAARDS
jgi:hypothetical protein